MSPYFPQRIIRHPSSVTLDAPLLSEFGDILPLTVTLNGALGGISGENITLSVLKDGTFELVETLITGGRGVISHNLVGLLAGSHTIRISFNGSDSKLLAPVSWSLR